MVEDLRKKFSFDANISCVMQETKIFHPGPPSKILLLYCQFHIENYAVSFDGGILKEEIIFPCRHFLCYARNENISPRPPPQLEDLKKKFSLDANISCVMQETKMIHQAPPPQLEDLRKKFSLDVNISCVMQETKIFHQGPPP